MQYFLLALDPIYTDAPVLDDWYKKVQPKDIKIGLSHNIPDRQIISVVPNQHMIFPDIISSPFLLLSTPCMDVLVMYEQSVLRKRIILMDPKFKHMRPYHLPILQRVKCLAEGSRWNMDQSVLEYGILDLDKIRNLSIFHIDDLSTTYTVIRLDALESMLKRGVKGLQISPMETTTKGGIHLVK